MPSLSKQISFHTTREEAITIGKIIKRAQRLSTHRIDALEAHYARPMEVR